MQNKNKESVLILGAGLMQKPAIISAKECGLKTFVIDANPFAECVKFADIFKQIDLKDKEKIFEYASELKNTQNLAGIFTAGTDFSSSVSFAAEKLGFSSHSYESSLNASVKSKMRQCFQKNNIPSPLFFSFFKEQITQKDYEIEGKIYQVVQKLGFPCVVKPVDNMGARGCRMIRNFSELESSVKDAFENSRSNEIIIEEYMSGPEFSIDAIIYNGTFTITGFADRHIYYPPYFIETGHTMPTQIDEQKKQELILTFAKGAKSLGLTCGSAKADIKYTSKGPQIGEIAARLSGGYMSGWTFPYSSGLNLTKQALLIATNKIPKELLKKRQKIQFLNKNIQSFNKNLKESEKLQEFKENLPYEIYQIPSKAVSAERAYISIPGKIKCIQKISKKSFFVKNIFPRPIKSGDNIDFPKNNVQKCGNVISKSKNYKKAVNASEKTCSNILIRLESNNQKTQDFLNNLQKSDEKGFPPNAFDFYEEICSLNLKGFIAQNQKVSKNIPLEILPFIKSNKKDWNYLTIMQTIKKFDKICKKHKPLNQNEFWKALFKGGLQAAVYFADSVK